MSRSRNTGRRTTTKPPTVRCARRARRSPVSEGDTMRAITVTVVAFVLAGVLAAQQPTFKRTVLQQADISVPGHEVISALAEFEPRATPGRHTHFGEEIGYILEG